jgi:hypothetical protein
MAQRNTPPSGKPAAKSGARSSAGGATAAKKPATGSSRPPARKPTKSIVNQKQRPWGLIVTTAVIVLFAVGVVVAVVATRKSSTTDPKNPYTRPEIAAAKAINGVVYKAEPNHNHVFTTVKYDTSPPTGGNHSQIWADCDGTVYSQAIANENAVHMLEHGSVWITYRPGLPAAQIATLSKLVNGVDRMAMSPYPSLKTPISLQAWGYQLFVNNASDPRIKQFISALRFNPDTTPEYSNGVTCSDPGFKTHPSTFGHPLFQLSS